MTLDTLVLERPDGADYTLRFDSCSVAVEYLGTEISDYLRRGFVPQGQESVDELEGRIEDVERYLRSRGNFIPPQVKKRFEDKYDSRVCDYIETSIEVRMEGAAAAFAPKRGPVGQVLIPLPDSFRPVERPVENALGKLFGISYGDTEEDTWEHELIHAAMRENPELVRMKGIGYGILHRMEGFYLPLPYSPMDGAISFSESAPLAFLPEQQELVDAYARSPLAWQVPWGVMSGLSTGTLALVGSGPLAALPAAYWLLSTGVRIPRVRRLKKQMHEDIGRMASLRERLGDAEALKLLAFMDRGMLEKTVGFIGENDISF